MNRKKAQIDNRQSLFAQRYGYQPLPDSANHALCKEFRDAIYFAVNPKIENATTRLAPYGPEQHPDCAFWTEITKITQTQILGVKSNALSRDVKEVSLRIGHLINDGHFAKVLSFCELILRTAIHYDSTIFSDLAKVFDCSLAPYALDDSAEPICIIPIETPESGEAIIEALDSIHQSGLVTAHQHLRDAAEHINAEQYGDAIADSVHAVEAIAREMTGRAKLDQALDALQEQGLLDHDALKQGVGKLYGYASDTARHGQPTAKMESVNQTRNEALLIFSSCAAIAGYLARSKMQMEKAK